MKKILSWAALAAMVFLGASCNKESQLEAGRGPVNVKIEVACPGSISTKSFSDGKKAKKLQYAIYATGTADTIKTGTAVFGDDLKTTVSATLVAGTSYDFIFWADAFGKGAAGSPYTVDLATQTMSVDYEAMATNEDSLDAFYCSETRAITSATSTLGFQLYRPFAQINFGTTDLEAARAAKFDVDNALYTVTVADAGEVLDLSTGEIAAYKTTPAVFEAVNMVGAAEDFPVADCAYLTMNYVLVDTDKTTTTATLGIKTAVTENDIPVYSVPVQRNYRTNIYGALLTNPVDITVEIVPGFADEDDEPFNVYAGGVVEPTKNAAGEWEVANAANLAAIAKNVNTGKTNYSGETIVLTENIDLSNFEWTPIGATLATPFAGTFNGNNKTISNLKITNTTGIEAAGLFGVVDQCDIKDFAINGVEIDATGIVSNDKNARGAAAAAVAALDPAGNSHTFPGVTNISVTNAKIKANHYAAAVVGHTADWNSNYDISGCSAENIEITLCFEKVNGAWDNCDKAGAVVGYVGSANANISNNTANNFTVTGYRHISGVIGAMSSESAYNNKAKNNRATNGTITIIADQDYKGFLPTNIFKYAYPVLGDLDGFMENENNTYENVNIVLKDASGYKKNAAGAYVLSTPADLQTIKTIVSTVSHGEGRELRFELTADVDMAGEAWEPISGLWVRFNGNGHTIKNLNCGTAYYGKSGFFAYLGGESINNLVLENVTAAGDQAGVVAGHIEGGKLNNVVIKGDNKVLYANVVNDAWCGVGAVAGVIIGSSFTGPQLDGTVTIYTNGMTTQCPSNDNYAYYTGAAGSMTVTGTGTVTIVDDVIAAVSKETLLGAPKDGEVAILNNIELGYAQSSLLWFDASTSGDVKYVASEGVVLSQAGHQTENQYCQIFVERGSSQNITVEGLTFDVASLPSPRGWAMNVHTAGSGTYTFKNCTFKGIACAFYIDSPETKIVLDGCKFEGDSIVMQYEAYSGAAFDPANYTVTNCDFGTNENIFHVYDYTKTVTPEDIEAIFAGNGNKYVKTASSFRQTNNN